MFGLKRKLLPEPVKIFKCELVSGRSFHAKIKSFNQVGVWLSHSESGQLIFVPAYQLKALSHVDGK